MCFSLVSEEDCILLFQVYYTLSWGESLNDFFGNISGLVDFAEDWKPVTEVLNEIKDCQTSNHAKEIDIYLQSSYDSFCTLRSCFSYAA